MSQDGVSRDGVTPFRVARHLADRGAASPRWREVRDGRAPRLGPREYIGDQVRRSGRFGDRDPLQTARLPSLVEWAVLALWVLLAGRRARDEWRRLRPFAARDDGQDEAPERREQDPASADRTPHRTTGDGGLGRQERDRYPDDLPAG